jgi:hypothetical protein
MKREITSIFCTIAISSGITAGLSAVNQRAQAQTSQRFLSVHQAKFFANKLPSPDELFDRQQREQEILQNRWQQQQEQKQQQQEQRFQQQIQQQQQQQFWLQQQQERQLQQFNQPK